MAEAVDECGCYMPTCCLSRADGTPGGSLSLAQTPGDIGYCFCAGNADVSMRARLTLSKPFGASLRTEVGPVNLKFTIPMHSASRISLKYLQILRRDKGQNPQRWVRYVTSSNSYTFRT